MQVRTVGAAKSKQIDREDGVTSGKRFDGVAPFECGGARVNPVHEEQGRARTMNRVGDPMAAPEQGVLLSPSGCRVARSVAPLPHCRVRPRRVPRPRLPPPFATDASRASPDVLGCPPAELANCRRSDAE